jgi:hypothetical protein
MADVTIYEHANFEGRSQVLPKGRYELDQLSIGNDSLSSLKAPQGLVVRLYEHYHFQGRFIDIKEDTPVVSQFWNDRTSSIIVYDEAEQPPVTKEVIIFEHANHGGTFQVLPIGEYDTAQILIGDNALSSALVPSGMVLRLYEDANYELYRQQGAMVFILADYAMLICPTMLRCYDAVEDGCLIIGGIGCSVYREHITYRSLKPKATSEN